MSVIKGYVIILSLGLVVWFYVLVGYYQFQHRRFEHQLQLVFCDVGQGDAILISLGNWQMLVDTGKDGQVLACLAQEMPSFDFQIEVLVLTHPDNDHMGAVNAVVDHYRVAEVLMIPYAKKTADFTALYTLLLKSNCYQLGYIWADFCSPSKVRFPTQGDGWIVDTKLHIKVLNPDLSQVLAAHQRLIPVPTTETILQDVFVPPEKTTIEPNDLSIVLFLRYGQHSFLLTGDIGDKTEQALIKRSLLTSTTVLKVAHHGSKSSTSDEFIDVVRPEIVIISAGKNNTYGHPAPETIARLRSRSITLFNTQEQGSITALTDGTSLQFFSKNGEMRQRDGELNKEE